MQQYLCSVGSPSNHAISKREYGEGIFNPFFFIVHGSIKSEKRLQIPSA